MGTNTNQIATRANINSGKRKYAYDNVNMGSDNDMYKCPTKGEINQIEFLDVKNASATTTENSKLAKYEDIGEDTARRFGVYYGVWNDKSTPARVDYARVLINTTPDTYASGWTQIGQVTLSDIAGNGTRSGVITCTLPANINLATTQYYIVIKVGDTLNNQDFYGGWGNAKEDVSYTYCRKSTSGWTPPIQLMPTKQYLNMNGEITMSWTSGQSIGVLNHIYTKSNGSITLVEGVYNTNPEYKGWVKIK